MTVTMVRCKPLSKVLRNGHADYMMLDSVKARQLEKLGHVEIVDKAQSVKKEGAEYQYLYRTDWERGNKKRVAWIQDYSKIGGAEISNATLVEFGARLGYDVCGITPSNFHEQLIKSADIVIVNNAMEFLREQFQTIQYHLYEKCVPYIKYDHDTREATRANISQTLFLRSRQNVFLSPAHRKFMQKVCLFRKFIELPLAIDADKFKPVDGVERMPGAALVPCYRKCKENFRTYSREHNDITYYVIGMMDEKPGQGVKVESLPVVESAKMSEYYSRFEFLWHMPDRLWAGERVYLEACLCGCKPLVNDNVGHASWGDFEGIRDSLKPSLGNFWKEVEHCL